MTVRPLIGISTYAESGVRWGVWQLDAALLPAGYPRLVQRNTRKTLDGPTHEALG